MSVLPMMYFKGLLVLAVVGGEWVSLADRAPPPESGKVMTGESVTTRHREEDELVPAMRGGAKRTSGIDPAMLTPDKDPATHADAAGPEPKDASINRYFYNSLSSLDCVAILVAIWLIGYAWWTRGSGESVSFMGLNSRLQFCVFTLYVILGSGHTFVQRNSGSTGYSVVAATALVCALKLIVSALMFFCRSDGSLRPLWHETHPRFGRTPAFVLLLVPAGLFALYDVLSFMALAKVDPVTYVIVRSSRIVLIVLVWQPVLRRTLSSIQVTSLLLLFLGTFTKGADHLSETEHNSALSGLLILAAMIVISVVASVASEVFLKELSLHTDLQNSFQYFSSLCFLLVGLCLENGSSALVSELLGAAAWRALLADKWMCASIVVLAVFGIVTAYFLKELSNILKELSHGFTVLVIAVVEWVFLGATMPTNLGLLALALTTLATLMYNVDPISNQSKAAPPVTGQKKPAGESQARG